MKNADSQLIEALHQIVAEKGIDIDLIFEAIESSLVLACKKNYGQNYNFKVLMNRETGKINCYAQKEVVVDVEDDTAQISAREAKDLNRIYDLGDIVDVEVTPKDFGRIAAQTAKQVIVQKIREAEREIIYNEYIQKEKELLTGIVQRIEKKNVVVSIGRIEAIMPPNDQIVGEDYVFGMRLKVYVTEVKQTSKGPVVSVSRTHPDIVGRLFEQEVPEIYDGIVEIRSISREAGQRSKIAVYSHNPDVDPVGACVGPGGSRVNTIVDELRGEKIDIINHSEDERAFIVAALSPSKVIDVTIDDETRTARVIVPKHQLSLAIGKDGQNARLAAKLTGFRIDIKSDEYIEETENGTSQAYQDFYEQMDRAEAYNDGDYDQDDAYYDEANYSEEDYYEDEEYYEPEENLEEDFQDGEE